MKLVRYFGVPMSVLGLVLYSPPVVSCLTPLCGEGDKLAGLITFAVGWALLFGDLVFHLGMETEKKRVK